MAGLVISPSRVDLLDIAVGKSETVQVTIRNVDKVVHQVRLRPPKTKHFSIHGFQQSIKLPPGLETTFEVTLHGETLEGVKEIVVDKVLIQADNGERELVLRGLFPTADVQIAGDLMFGVLPVESRAVKRFKLVNSGMAAAPFKLEWDKSFALAFNPAVGEVPPASAGPGKNEVEIECALTVADLGAASGEVTVLVGANAVDGRKREEEFEVRTFHHQVRAAMQMAWSATIVKQSFEVADISGALLQEVDFGAHFFGESVERKVTLFNNGPVEAKYLLSYGSMGEMRPRLEDDGSGRGGAGGVDDPDNPYSDLILATRQKLRAKATNDNPFIIGPLSGTIPPFSRATISLLFKPEDVPNRKGFTTTLPGSDSTARIFDFIALFEFAGCPPSTRIKLPVRGRGVAAGLRVSPMSFEFGDVPTHQYADQLCDLVNTSSTLPVTFAAAKSNPYFQLMPSSGKVYGGQTVQVMLRYAPKALGTHKASLVVDVTSTAGNKVQTLTISASGTCLTLGDKPALVAGTDKLPKDFEKPPNYVNDDIVVASKAAARARSAKTGTKFWEQPEVVDAFTGIGPNGTIHAMSKDEFVTVKAHKAKYVDAMRERRTAREKQHLIKQVDDADVNLGLDTRSGLKPMEPRLPRTVDPLWTAAATAEVRPQAQRVVSDAELAGISYHKDRPVGDAEAAVCVRELTRDQLCKLVVGPKIVDFGSVNVGGVVTHHLLVVNTLDTPIHVVLDLSPVPELKGSKHTSQVIPPGARAKFPLTLAACEIRSFTEKLEYCVNGSHVLDFSVSARVVPVTLDLSVEELNFEYGVDDWESFLEKMVLLNNPNPFPVEWTVSCTAPDLFTVTPTAGTVKPRSSAELLVRWQLPEEPPPAPPPPKADKKGAAGKEAGKRAKGGAEAEDMEQPSAAAVALQEGYLVLTLIGGDQPRRIYLQGQPPEGALRLKDKVLDGGSVPLGVPQSITAGIKNTGTRAATFKILPNPLLKITPDRARLTPDESMDLTVEWVCQEAGPLSSAVEVTVQGGRTLRLPFKSEGVLPRVEVQQDEFNFGPVYIGGVSKLPLTLANTTPVTAKIEVDLLKVPDLLIVLPKDAWNAAEYEEAPLVKLGVYGEVLAGGSHMGSNSSSRRVSRRNSSSLLGLGHALSSGGAKYHITVAPNKSLTLTLVYKPVSEGANTWELPFAPMVSTGPTTLPVIRKVVEGEGVRPKVIVSKSTLDFGQQIVIRSNQIKAPYQQEIWLTNHESAELDIKLGELQGPDSSVFSVEPQALTIAPGEMMAITIQFTPRDNKAYESSIPLFLQPDNTHPYISIELLGQGRHPKLAFDVRECVLPPVPLGITSRGQFTIVNEGYDNLELRFRLPADETHLPLNIEFPEGNLIGLAKERLPVVVTFTAQRPVSFTASIDFMDEDGKRYSIPVSASSDNCLLTHSQFFKINRELAILAATDDASPVQLTIQGGNPALWRLPPQSSVLGPANPSHAVVHFLNATTGRAPIEQLHVQLVSTRGKVFTELVEMLSGKALPGKVVKFASNKRDAAEQLLGFYDAALGFLRSHGALLNAVKPEMLLDSEDFGRVLNARATRAEASANPSEGLEAVEAWADVEENFADVSAAAWNTVVAQVFRVFVLGRVTTRALQGLPGAGGSQGPILPPESQLVGSNVFSVAECCLLAWASAHYALLFGPKAKRLTNFDVDFVDGLALFSLLAGHWPAFSSKRVSVHTGPGLAPTDCHDNAELVIRLMRDLGLPYELSANDICQPDPQEMMILVLYLFQALPQFLPRATVEFRCKLGETQVKELELSNPARKAIAYTARLEGHTDFTTDATTVRIDARGTVRFPLKCSPTTSLPQEARLVLASKRDGGGAHAATLVFLLHSQVNTRAPLKRLRTEGPQYEMQAFEFGVTNPFNVDCDFIITLLHEPAEKPPPPVEEPPKKTRGGSRIGNNKSADTPPPQPLLKLYPAAFGLDRTRLRLKAGATDKLRASFLPFTMGTHHCTVMLKDKDAGEFVYELVGEAGLPAPAMDVRGVVPLEASVHAYDLFVPWSNAQLDSAKRTFLEKHPLAKDKEQAALLKVDVFKTSQELEYNVSQTNSLIVCPSKLALVPSATAPLPVEKGGPLPGRPGEMAPPNVLRLGLKPVGTGLYPARLLLTSPLGVDTRVIDLELTAQTMTQQFELVFECATRQSITQEVPLVNTGDSYMAVVATLTGSKAFTGQREVSVPPGATVPYALTFKPPTPGDHKALLELSIPTTGERNLYSLTGKAAEPVAEAHVVVEAQARGKPVTRSIAVPNIVGQACEYQVLCDLSCVAGPAKAKVVGAQATTYKLTVAPVRSGVQCGTLTFKAGEGQSLWYSVEIRASEPPEVGVISVEEVVHQAKAIHIPVVNPMDEEVTLTCHYSDPVVFLGPPTLTLAPRSLSQGEPTTLEFYYAPVEVGPAKGWVSLVSEELGEFWYQVEMNALSSAPRLLPPLSAELGSRTKVGLPVSNPMDRTATLYASVAGQDAHAFLVSPPAITLPPYGEGELEVTYRPARSSGTEAARIIVGASNVGTWEWDVLGTPEAPSLQEPLNVVAPVGTCVQGSTYWRNPFPLPATVRVALTGVGADTGELALGFRQQPQSQRPSSAGGTNGVAPPQGPSGGVVVEREVAPGATLSLPIAFCPHKLHSASAELSVSVTEPVATEQVRGSRSGSMDAGEGSDEDGGGGEGRALERVSTSALGPTIVWRYPVSGVAEASQVTSRSAAASGAAAAVAPVAQTVFRFKCKAKSRVEEVVEVVLTGLGSVPAEGETFTYELVVPPQSAPYITTGLGAVLHVVPIGEPHITQPGQPLVFAVNFAPTKMMPPCTVELVVSKANGGRWRFELQLVTLEAALDGAVVLEAAMGVTASEPLFIFAPLHEPVPFKAWLSGDTPLSFNVFPSTGVLQVKPPPGAAESSRTVSPQRSLSRLLSRSGSARRASQSPPKSRPSSAGAGGARPAVTVTYTCKDFGKVVKGRLFVQAGETLYTYDLKGQMPVYVPPHPSDYKPTVDSRLTPEMAARLSTAASPSTATGRTNHVVANIRSSKARSFGLGREV